MQVKVTNLRLLRDNESDGSIQQLTILHTFRKSRLMKYDN